MNRMKSLGGCVLIVACQANDGMLFHAGAGGAAPAHAGPDSAPFTQGAPDVCAIGSGSYYLADVDHDGKTAWWSDECGRTSQVDLSLSGNDDCDDRDPSRATRAYPDTDGDGWISPTFGCFGEVPSGYLVHPAPRIDCDDEDAAVQLSAFGDRDGDGYGADSDVRCVAAPQDGGALPPNASSISGDCDDQNADRHPGAAEQWADGVDSNCDGNDDPLRCAQGECGCELLKTPPVSIDPSCTGADLFFVKVVTCRRCGGYDAVVVGNQGNAPVKGGFDLGGSDARASLHIAEDLAPGAVSHPIRVALGGFTAVLSTAVAQCNLTNDAIDLPGAGGICDP